MFKTIQFKIQLSGCILQAKRTGTVRVKIMLTELRIQLICNSCQMYIQLMSCYTQYVVVATFYHIIVHIY